MWSQRSWVSWAGKGKSNTKYFHSRATKRHQKNTIRGIRDETKQWCDDPNDIASILTSYYQGLFSASNPNLVTRVLSHVPPSITDDMNQELCSEFHECEVGAALKDMPSP